MGHQLIKRVDATIFLTTNPRLADVEKHLILWTLQNTQGDVMKATRILGISHSTLYRKMKQYGVRSSMFKEGGAGDGGVT